MSGCSCLTRRQFRRDPTDALFAEQSQSILDNLMELLGQSRACNGSAEAAPPAVVYVFVAADRLRWFEGGPVAALAVSEPTRAGQNATSDRKGDRLSGSQGRPLLCSGLARR